MERRDWRDGEKMERRMERAVRTRANERMESELEDGEKTRGWKLCSQGRKRNSKDGTV